jgi:hypothetical protein
MIKGINEYKKYLALYWSIGGILSPSDYMQLSFDAIEEGESHPVFTDIAALLSPDILVIDEIINKYEEFHLDKKSAAEQLLKIIAKMILNKQIPPREGAFEIDLISDQFNRGNNNIDNFGVWARECLDDQDPLYVKHCEEMIFQESKRVLEKNFVIQ